MGFLGLIGSKSSAEAPPPATPEIDGDGEAQPVRFGKFRKRLHAWWEGYYVDPEIDPNLEAPPTAPPTEEAVNDDKWSAPRIKIAELIWGDGFTFPGGVDHVIHMVKPMTLNSAKSMLDIGCGLGGTTRAIAKTFGTWVVGMEASPFLAKQGMLYSEKAGLAKKAPIQLFVPETLELPPKKYDAICIRNVFVGLSDKKPLLTAAARALRPGGCLLISDFAISQLDANSPAFRRWADGEETPQRLCTLEDFRTYCTGLRLDLRVAEDMTPEFRELVVKGWANLAEVMEGKSLDPEEARGLAQELQLWQRRLAAFASGELRVIRIFGIKGSDGV
ncbi:MAG: methyltransferase domain-containing protein [Alphaproteobacteria bacterium]|nr:methyltransferase domain-containing protein [Alphaproteobacteria bacterium]